MPLELRVAFCSFVVISDIVLKQNQIYFTYCHLKNEKSPSFDSVFTYILKSKDL